MDLRESMRDSAKVYCKGLCVQRTCCKTFMVYGFSMAYAMKILCCDPKRLSLELYIHPINHRFIFSVDSIYIYKFTYRIVGKFRGQ